MLQFCLVCGQTASEHKVSHSYQINYQRSWDYLVKRWFIFFINTPKNMYIKPILEFVYFSQRRYQPSLEKGSDQLTVTLYSLSICPSVHNQLILILFGGRPVCFMVLAKKVEFCVIQIHMVAPMKERQFDRKITPNRDYGSEY